MVVRHGRTAWNAAGRFQGQSDVPLDDEGRAQARAVGTMLASDAFDRAFASDLSRASETARIVLGERDVSLVLDERLREMRFGEWEGLVWNEIVERFPETAHRSSTTPRFLHAPGRRIVRRGLRSRPRGARRDRCRDARRRARPRGHARRRAARALAGRPRTRRSGRARRAVFARERDADLIRSRRRAARRS